MAIFGIIIASIILVSTAEDKIVKVAGTFVASAGLAGLTLYHCICKDSNRIDPHCSTAEVPSRAMAVEDTEEVSQGSQPQRVVR